MSTPILERIKKTRNSTRSHQTLKSKTDIKKAVFLYK